MVRKISVGQTSVRSFANSASPECGLTVNGNVANVQCCHCLLKRNVSDSVDDNSHRAQSDQNLEQNSECNPSGAFDMPPNGHGVTKCTCLGTEVNHSIPASVVNVDTGAERLQTDFGAAVGFGKHLTPITERRFSSEANSDA